MDSDVAELPLSHKLWAWLETNRKQAVWGAGVLVIVGFAVGFFFWQQGEKEITAGEELSNAALPQLTGASRQGASSAYLKVAQSYPKSSAGARAVLLAAATLFTEGKYDQAKTQFEKFTREHRDSPFLSEAVLGVAASLDAEGKTNEATTAYKELIDRHPNSIVLPQAKFALANLYEAQGKADQARTLFEDVLTKSGPYGSLGSEAGMRLEELNIKHPKAASAAIAPLTTPSVPFTTPSAPSTPTPTPAPLKPTSTPSAPTPAPTSSNAVPFKLQQP